MTTIQAVQKIVRAFPGHGDTVVSALDTGGSSDAGVAETYLDDAIRRVLAEKDFEENLLRAESWTPTAVLTFATSLTGVSYTNSTLTITKTGAFTNYTWRRKDRFHITGGTDVTADQWVEIASRTSNDAIVLATAPAGVNGNETDWTTDGIGYEYGIEFDDNTLDIKRAIETHDDIRLHGNLAFNRRRNDWDFGDATPVLVDRRIQLDFTDLPLNLQSLIVERAMVEYQRRRMGDAQRDAMLSAEKVGTEAAIEANKARTQPMQREAVPIVGSPFQPQQRQQ